MTSPFPPPHRAQVWLDFDGTLTRRDLLDDLIVNHSADDSWKLTEQLWQQGKIGSRQCLESQIALLRITDEALADFLTRVELDPGLPALLNLLDGFQIPRAILSDGIDSFIAAILARQNLTIPVRGNTLARDGPRLQLCCPHSRSDCISAAAHCKCGSIADLGSTARLSIYVGDGRSDLCPARKSEVVFAKGALAAALTAEGRSFLPFDTLLDVTEILKRHWSP